MSERINIQEILKKHLGEKDLKTLSEVVNKTRGIIGVNLNAAIKEVCEAVFKEGVDAGLALSTMSKEPFTTEKFQNRKKVFVEGLLKTLIDYE